MLNAKTRIYTLKTQFKNHYLYFKITNFKLQQMVNSNPIEKLEQFSNIKCFNILARFLKTIA